MTVGSDLPRDRAGRFRSPTASRRPPSGVDQQGFTADAPHVFEKVIRLPDGSEHLVVFVSHDDEAKVWRRLDQPPAHGWS